MGPPRDSEILRQMAGTRRWWSFAIGRAQPMNDCEQPNRPPFRGQNRYEAFKNIEQQSTENQSQITRINRRTLFTVTITASNNHGGNMDKPPKDEQPFLINLLFQPNDSKLRLRPAETQLLLSYI